MTINISGLRKSDSQTGLAISGHNKLFDKDNTTGYVATCECSAGTLLLTNPVTGESTSALVVDANDPVEYLLTLVDSCLCPGGTIVLGTGTFWNPAETGVQPILTNKTSLNWTVRAGDAGGVLTLVAQITCGTQVLFTTPSTFTVLGGAVTNPCDFPTGWHSLHTLLAMENPITGLPYGSIVESYGTALRDMGTHIESVDWPVNGGGDSSDYTDPDGVDASFENIIGLTLVGVHYFIPSYVKTRLRLVFLTDTSVINSEGYGLKFYLFGDQTSLLDPYYSVGTAVGTIPPDSVVEVVTAFNLFTGYTDNARLYIGSNTNSQPPYTGGRLKFRIDLYVPPCCHDGITWEPVSLSFPSQPSDSGGSLLTGPDVITIAYFPPSYEHDLFGAITFLWDVMRHEGLYVAGIPGLNGIVYRRLAELGAYTSVFKYSSVSVEFNLGTALRANSLGGVGITLYLMAVVNNGTSVSLTVLDQVSTTVSQTSLTKVSTSRFTLTSTIPATYYDRCSDIMVGLAETVSGLTVGLVDVVVNVSGLMKNCADSSGELCTSGEWDSSECGSTPDYRCGEWTSEIIVPYIDERVGYYPVVVPLAPASISVTIDLKIVAGVQSKDAGYGIRGTTPVPDRPPIDAPNPFCQYLWDVHTEADVVDVSGAASISVYDLPAHYILSYSENLTWTFDSGSGRYRVYRTYILQRASVAAGVGNITFSYTITGGDVHYRFRDCTENLP